MTDRAFIYTGDAEQLLRTIVIPDECQNNLMRCSFVPACNEPGNET
jgi:hypothetical protein